MKKRVTYPAEGRARRETGTFVPDNGEAMGKPVAVALPIEADEIVRSLPNRSAKLREWILEGMRREGLL